MQKFAFFSLIFNLTVYMECFPNPLDLFHISPWSVHQNKCTKLWAKPSVIQVRVCMSEWNLLVANQLLDVFSFSFVEKKIIYTVFYRIRERTSWNCQAEKAPSCLRRLTECCRSGKSEQRSIRRWIAGLTGTRLTTLTFAGLVSTSHDGVWPFHISSVFPK